MADTNKVRCEECGRSYKAGGLAVHKIRVHGGNKWNSKPKAVPKPVRKPQQIVLREVYTDGGENGRILLTDQYGNWWVARKLDV